MYVYVGDFCRTPQLEPGIRQRVKSEHPEAVFTLGDARSFSGLTSKIPPLGSMLNFDADVKKPPRVAYVKTA